MIRVYNSRWEVKFARKSDSKTSDSTRLIEDYGASNKKWCNGCGKFYCLFYTAISIALFYGAFYATSHLKNGLPTETPAPFFSTTAG